MASRKTKQALRSADFKASSEAHQRRRAQQQAAKDGAALPSKTFDELSNQEKNDLLKALFLRFGLIRPD